MISLPDIKLNPLLEVKLEAEFLAAKVNLQGN